VNMKILNLFRDIFAFGIAIFIIAELRFYIFGLGHKNVLVIAAYSFNAIMAIWVIVKLIYLYYKNK
jgi:hypothetical protein